MVAEKAPNRANTPNASGGAGVDTGPPAGVAVPARAVPPVRVAETVVVPPGVLVRSGVPVPVAGDAVEPGVPVPPGVPDTVAAAVPGVPSGNTVVPGGGRVDVGCARCAAPTVAETRACTVASTFTGAAVSPHAASDIARTSTPTRRTRDTNTQL